jgi:hypothetical protein
MTEAEKSELKALMGNKGFQAFLYRMIRSAGLFSVAAHDSRPLEFVEGRRSLALDILNELELLQDVRSPDGLPVLTSIQILLSVAQSATKEKDLGRRNDLYRDINSGDGDPE